MGRNKKSHKHRKIKQLSRRRIKHLAFPLLLCTFIYVIILITFGVLGAGSAWEMWKESEEYFPLLLSLSIYRILEYVAPAIILKITFKKPWAEAFNYQFACYALINAVVFLFGLDYAFDIELFSSSDSFIIIIGYIISLVAKNNVSINNTVDVIENINPNKNLE